MRPETTPGAGKAMDVAHLPEHAFGPRATIWWGMLGFTVLEGVAIVVLVTTYLYFRKNFAGYPPGDTPRPELLVPTLNLAVMLASTWTAVRIGQAAKKYDQIATRRMLFASVAFAAVFLVLRIWEFGAVHVKWNTNAYGTIVWAILAAHTAHVLSSMLENSVLGVLFWKGPVLPRHYVDANEGAFYWFFVVAWWVMLYVVVFLGPYLL